MGNKDMSVILALALAVIASIFIAGFLVYHIEEWKKVKEESVQSAEMSMIVNEAGVSDGRLYANLTFNCSGCFDLFTIIYEPIVIERVVVGWREVSFSLTEVFICDRGPSCVVSDVPVFYENLSLIGDGFYKVVFELWDRVGEPGESFLVCEEVFFVFPEEL